MKEALPKRLNRNQLRRITVLLTPPLLPELKMRGLPDDDDFDQFRTLHADAIGAAAPYWAVAWPGGQALARFVLDRPEIVRGRQVIDVGCGAGLAATAAKTAGAVSVEAVDIDPNALLAAAETATLNGVGIATRQANLETLTATPGTVICAGDMWYERETGRRATAALERLARAGATILCGDPGRPGRPRRDVVDLARYDVEVSTQFEPSARARARVFAVEASTIRQAHYPYAQWEGRRRHGFRATLCDEPKG